MKAQEFVAGLSHAADLRNLAENLIAEMRPQEWRKNLLVFVPLLPSQNILVPGTVGNALIAFFAFCLMSSSVYLLNDLADYKRDKIHPEKSLRPLAAGKIEWTVVLEASLVLFLFSLASAVILEKFALILVVYWLINLLYSAEVEHRLVSSVLASASGLILRVVGGAAAIDVSINPWLIIAGTFVALLLAVAKCRFEPVPSE